MGGGLSTGERKEKMPARSYREKEVIPAGSV
jgi:hypothetical protein